MKAYTDEQVKQIEDALEKNLQSLVAGVTFDMTTEALATLRSGQDGGEPVAYVVALPGRWISMTAPVAKLDLLATMHNAPLYAAPQSAQPAPLTDEQIDSIQAEYIRNLMPGPRVFARAIEAAHGIVAAQRGTP